MMRSELGIDIEHDVNIHLENRKESRYFFAFIWILYAVVYMTKKASGRQCSKSYPPSW